MEGRVNDTELNRTVAEAAGWTQIRECEDSFFQGLLVGVRGDGVGMAVPDFANSYDAIMPLVKALKGMQRNRFADHLFKAVFPDHYVKGWMFTHMMHAYITATPRQLCEAYLAVGGADA
jgi:hypothetical protein